LHEYLEEFPGKQDVLRYVLAANMPETKDNDFTWKDFQARNNNELVAILGNFINRTAVLTQKYYDRKVPALGAIQAIDKETIAEMAQHKERIESSLESYRFREALKEAMNLARLGNKYLADTEPWKLIKTDEARVETIMNICIQLTANLSIVFEPFMPFTAQKIRQLLHIESLGWEKLGQMDLLAAGHLLDEPFLLFDKIEDESIEAQVQKLEATRKSKIDSTPAVEAKELITYDDFTKLDIRTGTILEAEKVAKTKKLLKLLVDTGIDKRTVVSGIAEYYNPEELKGKKVSILVNLAPRSIKGIESQGMILMAENADGSLSFVSSEKQVNNGSEIK
jgi:methionyl-tRNA synthetase